VVRAGLIGRLERWAVRHGQIWSRLRLHRGGGIAASALILIAALSFGVIQGGHIQPVNDVMQSARDAIGRTMGFPITTITFSGNKHLTRDEILARAGVSGSSSLLFFDVTAARARLVDDPRISDATILKLYPDRLQISVTERQPFALWQINRQVSVIADDGAVLLPYVPRDYVKLPMFVGRGAEKRGKQLLAILDRYPDIRDQLRASILVAERRWNLRLTNGLDIKLPEVGIEAALDRLVNLDRETKLISRDIVSVDLREPDRVTAKLSEAAAQARDAALKEKAKQKKSGSV
jgi:cell division protein FtsQ